MSQQRPQIYDYGRHHVVLILVISNNVTFTTSFLQSNYRLSQVKGQKKN